MKRYSFIIPAHNAETTIRTAVDSIARRVPGAEIIVIENGSSDRTFEVVENLAAGNADIVLLRSETGVSAARNEGLRRASGEWIIFVDADDVWLADAACLDRLTSSDADLIVCGYRKGHSQVTHAFRPRTMREARDWMLSRPTLRMTVWAKLYRGGFLRENRLLFDTSLSFSEDSEFLVRCLTACRSVMVSDEAVYDYRMAPASATRSANRRRTRSYLQALELVRKQLPLDQAYRNFVSAHVNLIGVHDVFDCAVRCPWRKRTRKMKAVMKQEAVREVYPLVTFPCGLQLLPFFFFKHGMYSLGGCLCFIRSASNRRAYRK